MNDTSKLYDIIWDSIESLGDYSYIELVGVLEMIKAEVMEEYFGVIDNLNQAESEE